MAICNTCHHPRCGYTHCNASKTSCPTCHETNIPTPVTPGTDMLSANLHHKGLHFAERITGMGSNPKSIEMDLEEIDPQTDPNIRFRVVVRGWSNKNQQARARSLLALSNEKMANAHRRQQDILLIPRLWCSVLQDSLGPEDPGWWYTVSDDIYFQECRTCERRLGKDHQDTTRCPKCPANISKKEEPGLEENPRQKPDSALRTSKR